MGIGTSFSVMRMSRSQRGTAGVSPLWKGCIRLNTGWPVQENRRTVQDAVLFYRLILDGFRVGACGGGVGTASARVYIALQINPCLLLDLVALSSEGHYVKIADRLSLRIPFV